MTIFMDLVTVGGADRNPTLTTAGIKAERVLGMLTEGGRWKYSIGFFVFSLLLTVTMVWQHRRRRHT